MARPRRGNGEGTYVKHADGRHEWRIPIPGGGGAYRSVSDRNYQKSIKKRNELRKEMERGLVVASKQTVAQYLEGWLEGQRTQVKAVSHERYEEYIHLHIVPAIGHVVLKDLTAQQVQKMETTLLKTKSSRGTLYSPTTVRQMHTVLKGALKDALSMHLVLENVAGAFKAPKSATKEMKYWTPAEARTFLASVRGHRLEALFTLALSTGARQGELLALTWGDVDFAKGTCSIRRTIRYVVGGGFRFTEPKTLKSKRTIKLTQATLAALKSHRARQAEERLAAGAAWQNTHDLMFTTAHGTPVLAQNLDKQFAKLVQAEGVPPIRWHDMRHTCATILLSHGANIKAVSELLGHSDIAITLRIYAHVLPNMHDQMASIMEEALFG